VAEDPSCKVKEKQQIMPQVAQTEELDAVMQPSYRFTPSKNTIMVLFYIHTVITEIYICK